MTDMELTGEDLLRLEEIVKIIKDSNAVDFGGEHGGECESGEGQCEGGEGQCGGKLVSEDDDNSAIEETKEEVKQIRETNQKETLIIYSLALKRLIIEKYCELDQFTIDNYMKQFKASKKKTQLRNSLKSSKFRDLYDRTYAKNLQEGGADSIFAIPLPKQEVQISFIAYIKILYDSFVKCHTAYKNNIIKIVRQVYKETKAKVIQQEYACIVEFTQYYEKNRDIFTEEKFNDTIQYCNEKYGAKFLQDMHPVLYILSALVMGHLSIKLVEVYLIDTIKCWLDIRFDDGDDELKIKKLFVKMFYQRIPATKKNADKYADEYADELKQLLDAEAASKENVRQELMEESNKLKEERKKDDIKLNISKILNKKKAAKSNKL